MRSRIQSLLLYCAVKISLAYCVCCNKTGCNKTAFLTSISSRYGNPTTLISDNGPQFTLPEFLKERVIKHIRTSVYHPAANEAIKWFQRVLKSTIQSAILQSAPWKATVTDFLQIYCVTPMISVFPFELLHGRKMHTSFQKEDKVCIKSQYTHLKFTQPVEEKN